MSLRDYEILNGLEDNWLEPDDDGIDHFFCKKCDIEISEEESDKNNELCQECNDNYDTCRECNDIITQQEYFKYDEMCCNCHKKAEEKDSEDC